MLALAFILLCFAPWTQQTNLEYEHLGRPCRMNHCDAHHVCVRRKDLPYQYRCVQKSYLKEHLEKIAEWDLNPRLIDELVERHDCRSCLSEPLEYVCGTNGRMYRSPCFVEYFNCLFNLSVHIECHRECPCSGETDTEEPQTLLDDVKLAEENNDIETHFTDPLADNSLDDPRGYFDQCPRSVHRSLRNRFFDWFHQLAKLDQLPEYNDPSLLPKNNPSISIDTCPPVVISLFHHLDFTNDSELNDDELNSIEHLKDEICTETFFKRCDQREDHRLFIDEWCQCFEFALLPCEYHNAELDKLFWNQSMEGIFRPRCTREGYFAPRQCDVRTPRECWCVDQHGIELEQTRTTDDHLLECGGG